MFGRTKLALTAMLLMGSLGLAIGGDAGGRGINDSNITTLVGGVGNGSTNAKNVPLRGFSSAGIARNAAGNLFFTEDHRIMQLTPAGVLSNIAGTPNSAGFSGDGGPATGARLNSPTYLTFDSAGNLYVVDNGNNRIRKIGTDGNINTIGGRGGFTINLQDIGRVATDATLANGIVGIAVNAAGEVFFAASSTACIYKIGTDGRLSVVAGDGNNAAAAAGGLVALANPLGGAPRGLALLADGTLVFSAQDSIRQIDAAGNNIIIAGLINNTTNKVLIPGTPTFFPDDGTQDALQVQPLTGGVLDPQQIAVDGSTIFFWDDSEGHVRSFTIGGKIQTVFGDRTQIHQTSVFGFRGDASPAATSTLAPGGAGPFNSTLYNDDPLADVFTSGLVASGGVVTMIDQFNGLVRQFTVGGNVNTIAGASNGFRVQNLGGLTNTITQQLSNNAPVSGKDAPLASIEEVTASAAGVFFSATDVNSGFNGIYKYDGATQNVTLVAGMQYVNGRPVAPGEGGLAESLTSSINNIDTASGQVSPLTAGGFLFIDRNTSNYARAVDANGVLSTLAGNGTSARIDPNGDGQLRTGTASQIGTADTSGTTRTGKAATAVGFFNMTAILGTTTTDFFVAENGTGGLTQITAGNVTQVIPIAGLNQPYTYLAQSGAFVFVGSETDTEIYRIDLTVPATPVVGLFFTAAANVRGFGIGTAGMYVLDAGTGLVNRIPTAELSNALPGAADAATNAGFLRPNTGNGGFAVSGLSLFFADTGTSSLVRLTDANTGLAGSINAPTTVAGQFTNVFQDGFLLQSNFEFVVGTNNPLVVMPDGRLLVGSENQDQYRYVTLGATAPLSSYTVAAFPGAEGNSKNTRSVTGASDINVNGLAVDATGNVYYSSSNDVRRINGTNVETFLGLPYSSSTVRPGANRLLTGLNGPVGLTFNAAGELHVALSSDQVVVKTASDVVSVVAGTVGLGGVSGDGFAGTLGRLDSPTDIVFNKNGDLYIIDSSRLALLSKNNVLSTLFDDDSLFFPNIALDTGGKVYLGGNNTIHRFDSESQDDLIPVAGDAGNTAGWNGDGIPAIRALFNSSSMDVAFDATLGLLVADSQNGRLRAITNLAETTNTAPIAAIVANPGKQGSVPFKVRFDGTTSFDADGDIVSYVWDFGDTTTGSGPTVEHTFTAQGSYVVTLTVTDSQGQTSTARTTVFAALPLVGTSTTGKGSFKVAFGAKGNNKDSFSLVATNVTGLTDQAGKTAKIFIGSFTINGTVGGKGVKVTSKQVKLVVDTKKKSVALQLKGVELDTAFEQLGVTNANSVGGKGGKVVPIPVVIDINNGALVVGDTFDFIVVTKFNSGASGKYSQ